MKYLPNAVLPSEVYTFPNPVQTISNLLGNRHMIVSFRPPVPGDSYINKNGMSVVEDGNIIPESPRFIVVRLKTVVDCWE